MTSHKVGTREEWLADRLKLLDAEKALTRRADELAKWRQELPWVPINKDYRFETDDGPASLDDLFGGRSQLLVYHFMFGPDYTAGCPSCSAIADGFDGITGHLANHDVTLCAVSRVPFAKLQAYKQRMGWSFPWASSGATDFNHDFQAALTEEQQQSGAAEYNFGARDMRPPSDISEDASGSPEASEQLRDDTGWVVYDHATSCGVNWATYMRDLPGVSAFVLEDGIVYHTYSAYARGLDGLWGMYQWLDRAPRGRNETRGTWFRRHDEYDTF